MRLTVLFAGILYVAVSVLVLGTLYRVYGYLRVPAPLKIPTMPAPTTVGGVCLRILREVVAFESLFKASRWTWAFGWVFHAALLVVLAGHVRFFTQDWWRWLPPTDHLAPFFGLMMMAGLAGLWARRLLVDRVRYISAPSDHLMLGLLLAIAVSGMLMSSVDAAEIAALKAFATGLPLFELRPIPENGVILAHLSLVAMLMLVFPFSKLMHAPGLFFSPTRYQVDDSRERRHLAPWAAELEARDNE